MLMNEEHFLCKKVWMICQVYEVTITIHYLPFLAFRSTPASLLHCEELSRFLSLLPYWASNK